MRGKRTLALGLVALLALSLFAPVALADSDLEYGDERADLDIWQPPWIDDDVAVERTDNRTIYEASGGEIEVALADVGHEHVEDVRVVDGSADIEYDEDRSVWVVDPGGEGTIAVQWRAVEPVIDDEGNETGQTETTRYAASLRIDDTEWTHIRDDEFSATQQDAENWSAVEREAQSIAPDRSVNSVLSTGFAAAKFLDSPGAAIFADIQGTLIMMTMRPGGLLVLGTFLFLIGATAAAGFRWRHRAQNAFEDHDLAKGELKEAYLSKARKILQQYEWWEILPDKQAQWMFEKFGPNVWYGAKQYRILRSTLHTKGLVLQMMAQLGYVGVVHYDSAGNVTQARALTENEYEDEYGGIDVDGGSDDDDDGGTPPDVIDVDGGPATDGGVLEVEQFERISLEELRFDDETDREIIDHIPADDLDESVFLPSVELDFSRVSLPIDNHDIEDSDLVRVTEPQIPEHFESYEQYARVLARMHETVVNHPYYTDDDGNVREEMDLLSFLAELDSVMADKAEFAVADVERKILMMVAEELDANDRAANTLRDAYETGVGRDDERESEVIGPEDVDLGGSNPGGDGR